MGDYGNSNYTIFSKEHSLLEDSCPRNISEGRLTRFGWMGAFVCRVPGNLYVEEVTMGLLSRP